MKSFHPSFFGSNIMNLRIKQQRIRRKFSTVKKWAHRDKNTKS